MNTDRTDCVLNLIRFGIERTALALSGISAVRTPTQFCWSIYSCQLHNLLQTTITLIIRAITNTLKDDTHWHNIQIHMCVYVHSHARM